ncbi:MAG: hypothetical protein U0264_05275 [Candidatus Kapaibacterium sp.]
MKKVYPIAPISIATNVAPYVQSAEYAGLPVIQSNGLEELYLSHVTLFDANKRPVGSRSYQLTNDDYAAWTNDDESIYSVIYSAMGITRSDYSVVDLDYVAPQVAPIFEPDENFVLPLVGDDNG